MELSERQSFEGRKRKVLNKGLVTVTGTTQQWVAQAVAASSFWPEKIILCPYLANDLMILPQPRWGPKC